MLNSFLPYIYLKGFKSGHDFNWNELYQKLKGEGNEKNVSYSIYQEFLTMMENQRALKSKSPALIIHKNLLNSCGIRFFFPS
jgi:hypothetical protein